MAQQENSVFKVGDVVFDYVYANETKLVVTEVNKRNITVKREDNGTSVYYKLNGALSDTPTLSFVEYTLSDGKFTQERPKEVPNSGQMIYVKNNNSKYWSLAYFIGLHNDKVFATHLDPKERIVPPELFDEYSIKNPLIKYESL